LKYHGLFDQGLKKYRSISQKQYLTKNIEDVEYSYIKVKKENYFGFQERQVDTDLVQIAEAERALLDLLEYQRTTHSVSLVLEKIQLYQSELNLSHLTDYASQFSQTSIKIMGFIFDLLQIDSSKLYQLIQSKDSTHRMFTSSAAFDKRWRLYYEEILKEQVA
jgi:predicted transcriptional regulator of viral defense system